ncbi:glycosyltransferase family 2 protein [Lacisediminihabitans profunda]|uniref:Glycosyltransferase n=1 Tax=Lacisediminihabitans profunda TaxID=2594790 RepID=A0A5C8UKG0_9MICO|nr:glycosyltransferase [Lacisediminihabitans profunda]TXN28788.1 glycosyltransferase [Lacisediminihabitans profunda]
MSGASRTLWVFGAGHPISSVRNALRSALGQSSQFEEVVGIVDAGMLDQLSLPDSPTRLIAAPDGDGSGLLNTLLAQTPSDWIVWLDAGNELTREANATLGRTVGRFDIDLFYGDTQLADGEVRRRPAPSPIRLLSQDYLGGVRGFRSDRLRSVGGFRPGLDGAHPYDIALRLGADERRVLAIPEVLSRSVSAIGSLTEAHRSASADAVAARGVTAEVSLAGSALRLRYPIDGAPLVSIVIPTRGGRATIRGAESVLVVDAVRGMLERTTYAPIEIVVVADDETPQAVIDSLVEVAGERLRLVRWSGPFNFSGKMNRGAVHARGDYLVLVNDDVELISADWIEVMLGLAQQPGIGLVGTMLYFEDGTVQHGGHLYRDSWAGHIAFGWESGRDDALGSLGVDREVSGVTAACAMISADTFWEVGGFSPLYAGNYNDVDLSLKVRSTGRSIVWTPHAELFHFESKSRVATVVPEELATIRRHWGTRLLSDPYWR